jgi:hypothetical protein
MSGSNLGSLRQSRGVLPAMVPTFRRYPDRGGITNARQSTDLLLVAKLDSCARSAHSSNIADWPDRGHPVDQISQKAAASGGCYGP